MFRAALEKEGDVVGGGAGGEGLQPDELAVGRVLESSNLLADHGEDLVGGGIRPVIDGAAAEVLEIVGIVFDPTVPEGEEEVFVLLEREALRQLRCPEVVGGMEGLGEGVAVVVVEFVIEGAGGDEGDARVVGIPARDDGLKADEGILVGDLGFEESQRAVEFSIAWAELTLKNPPPLVPLLLGHPAARQLPHRAAAARVTTRLVDDGDFTMDGFIGTWNSFGPTEVHRRAR